MTRRSQFGGTGRGKSSHSGMGSTADSNPGPDPSPSFAAMLAFGLSREYLLIEKSNAWEGGTGYSHRARSVAAE
jgi:hypothetical protein